MEELSKIIEDFSRHSMQSGRVMRQLLEKNRDAFFDSALPLLRAGDDSQGFHYLLTILLLNDLILAPLVDPSVFSFQEAVSLAKSLMKIEPLLDIRMIRSLMDSRNADEGKDFAQKIDSVKGIRLLEVMSTISDGARILPMMAQLLHHSSIWVRSKAALIVGKGNKNHKWVEQRLGEPDARVRANAVESLWGVDSEGSRAVFWAAVSDTDNRVVGNALLGLYRLGEVSSIPLIFDLLQRSDALFRTTGVWVMGETGDPRFRPLLARLLSDGDAKVRAIAFRSVARIKQNEARFSAVADAHLHLTPSDAPGASWIHLSAALWAGNAKQGRKEPIIGLKPTQFLIQENRQLITQYEIDEVTHPETISAAFAIPRGLEANDPFHANCKAGLGQALLHKKKADSWLILKYLPDLDRPEHGHGTAVRAADRSVLHLQASAEPAAASPIAATPLPGDVRFMTDGDAIIAAAAAPGTRVSLPAGVLETARTLIPVLAQTRGSRHLVFVAANSSQSVSDDPAWTEISRTAKAAKVRIHVLGLSPLEQLQGMAERTGGRFRLLSSAEEIPMALETFYAGLLHHYSIRYRSVTTDSRDVSVQVYSGHGLAESHLSHSAPAVHSANVA